METAVTLPNEATGVGGASNLMKFANATASDVTSPGGPDVKLVWSSGVALNIQPAVSPRFCGKASFVTPCSTLYASPEKISRDLFCAFQPKRVMVPALPSRF